MRVSFKLRDLAFVAGLALLSANHAYAQATAAVVTPAAGQAVQVAAGAARVAGGVVAGGYLITTATLEFAGGVATRVAWRIGAGAAVAAAASGPLAALIGGGLVLGAAAPYVRDWLMRAHSDGVALDLYYDPPTDSIRKRTLRPPTEDYNGIDPDRTIMPGGQSLSQQMGDMASNYPYACYQPHNIAAPAPLQTALAPSRLALALPNAEAFPILCRADDTPPDLTPHNPWHRAGSPTHPRPARSNKNQTEQTAQKHRSWPAVTPTWFSCGHLINQYHAKRLDLGRKTFSCALCILPPLRHR